jgi:small subunit ribosomal protein S6
VNLKVRGVIESGGGTLLKVDNWGKRKLAYEVKKQLKGIYLYWQYLGSTGVVEEIERNLRMLDQVIRYYTVKVDENVDPTAKPAAIDDETFNKAASTVPDEEELATGAAQLPRFEEDDIPDLDDEFLPALDDDLPIKGKE